MLWFIYFVFLFSCFFFYFLFFSFFFFFFSSRRRHTRYIGDWSSDVCSSDLSLPLSAWWNPKRTRISSQEPRWPVPGSSTSVCRIAGSRVWSVRSSRPATPRSEERRVGKEGRAWGSGGAEKKKMKEREECLRG